MRDWKTWFAVSILCLSLTGRMLAQEPPPPPPPPAEPEEVPPTPPAEPTEPGEPPPPPPTEVTADVTTTPETKDRFGLYVGFAAGTAKVDDIDTSLITSGLLDARNKLSLDKNRHGRAAVGWQLPDGKGDFRLVFNGYKETSYEFSALGRSTDGDIPNWYLVRIQNGQLESRKYAVVIPEDVEDLTQDELLGMTPIRIFTKPVTDSLQNEAQTVDALYGREFGKRRFSSRWWGGLRYFKYEGNVLAGAWLSAAPPGAPDVDPFTTGSYYRLLVLSQDTSGFGPTGSWEIDFNFLNRGLVLFARGQSAFAFTSVEADTGEFFVRIEQAPTANSGQVVLNSPGRLHEKRDKSSWQNTGEAGVRVLLRNGLQFEAGYQITGLLDVILVPSSITVPSRANQFGQEVSAFYRTEDYVLKGWYVGAAFQF